MYGQNGFTGGIYVQGGKLIVSNPSALADGSSLTVGAAAAFGGPTVPASQTAGSALNLVVVAQDAYNNTVTGYSGTIQFSSSDAAAILPANATLAGGSGTFSAMLKTAGSQTITATDTVSGSITGSRAP